MDNNRCVTCGAIIPEGIQICPNCEKKSEDKLKPCPFCGSTNIVKTTWQSWGVSKQGRSRIECKNCGLKTRQFEDFKNENAEEYWNRRVKNEKV